MKFESEDESNPWFVIREEVKFDCTYFAARSDVVRHSDGPPRAYNSIRMKYYGVCVAPIDNDGRVTLVGQYRYVLNRFTWELPGGGARRGSPPLDVAKAELSEETGFKASQWLKVFEAAVAPGTLDEITPGFIAWDVERGEPHPDPEERLSLRQVPFSEAVSMALRGGINNMPGVALLTAIQVRLQRGDLPDSLAALLRRG